MHKLQCIEKYIRTRFLYCLTCKTSDSANRMFDVVFSVSSGQGNAGGRDRFERKGGPSLVSEPKSKGKHD